MDAYSNAIGIGICSIDTWLQGNNAIKLRENGQATKAGALIEGLYASSKQLHFTTHILEFAAKTGSQTRYRNAISALAELEDVFEHLAANLGLEALSRAEQSLDRIVPLLRLLPAADPPPTMKRCLEDAATCYLLHLDDQCIVMCRAAVEVMVEELDPSLESEHLGVAIGLLVPKRISQAQADEMREINRQAREIMHRTPSRRQPSATECLEHLTRLLAQLYPADM